MLYNFSSNTKQTFSVHAFELICRWPSLLCITLPKRYNICICFTLPGLKKPGRNHFTKNSCWMIKDLGILDSQNNLWTNSFIGVQGNCPYIFFSITKFLNILLLTQHRVYKIRHSLGKPQKNKSKIGRENKHFFYVCLP